MRSSECKIVEKNTKYNARNEQKKLAKNAETTQTEKQITK